jgi:DNA-binding transcriptional LysR family regulator
MLRFVAGGLGVSIVPSGLARFSVHSGQLHVLRITTQGHRLPKWRVVIATRAQKRQLPGKTTVELFLETLATLQAKEKPSRSA